MAVGKSITRVDAMEKVTGGARYTDDFFEREMLVGKVLHSTIANGIVKAMDTTEAEHVPGVVKIITCFDVPEIQFPTPGHPWSTDKGHQDVSDRRLLNRRVRIFGDDIAAVVAEDEVAAKRALAKIKVEYEEYEPLIRPEDAMKPDVPALHEEYPDNILKHTQYAVGESFGDAAKAPGVRVFQGEYQTQVVQHCHIELPVSYAYMEHGRVVVVSSTQIPHIVRRVIGQATGLPWGKIRVIKPYIGGGFGNKQEVLYEPLNAYMSMQVGGRCVKLEISREETFSDTRTRHAIGFQLASGVKPDGTLAARKVVAVSNQGGYASHGHAIVANSVGSFRHNYRADAIEGDAYTVYTNLSSAGAMRGYGIPQICFALESHMDDIARELNLDPIEFRMKNAIDLGYNDPLTKPFVVSSCGLAECIEKGKRHIGWEEKRARYANQTGPVRRGVGFALFSYKTGVFPISLETASCRIVLNQDGSAQLQMGATEIGQGADTAFTQMAAETTGLRAEDIHIVSTQDTDISPFDTGAYASRQAYVSGMALRKTAELFQQKLLDYAEYMLKRPADGLDVRDGAVVDKQSGEALLPLAELALESFYSLENSVHITAEATYQCKHNTFSFGCCFAEVEVDMPLGKVKVLDIINVHDSGLLVNPRLAEAQVHGGMSMGLGYALSEQLLFGEKGQPLNGNLLDYKLPTSLDTPDLNVEFVETNDPTGPYGNKSLGEPPAIPGAPAIRNAVLHATGVGFNSLPLNPEKLVLKFQELNLI